MNLYFLTELKRSKIGTDQEETMSKKYPALYTTSTKGTFFKHCSINKTIYFELLLNEEEALKNSEYKEYKLKEGEFNEAKHQWHVFLCLSV